MHHSFLTALLLAPLAAQAASSKTCKPKTKTCPLKTVTQTFTVTGKPGQIITTPSARPSTSGLVGSSAVSSNAPGTPSASMTTPGPLPTESLTTSTIYTTSIQTVTNCGPQVTNCPGGSTVLVTRTIPISTTVCPITKTPSSSGSATSQTTPGSTGAASSAKPIGSMSGSQSASASSAKPTGSMSPSQSGSVTDVGDVTSTLYTTQIRTITDCGPAVTSCPAKVTTETLPYSTTVIPSSRVSSMSTPVPTPTSAQSSAKPIDSSKSSMMTPSGTISRSSMMPSGSASNGGQQGSTTVPPIGDVTSYIYTTQIRTVTNCGPQATRCPGNGTSLVTETIPISTKVTTGKADGTTVSASSSMPPESMTTSTIFTTTIRTVTDCGSGNKGCTSGKGGSTVFVTETIPISTTVCPISDLPVTPTASASATATGVPSSAMTPSSSVMTPSASSSSIVREPSVSSTASTPATKTASSPFEGATGIDIVIPEIRQCEKGDRLDLPGMPWAVTNDVSADDEKMGKQCTNFNRVVVSNGTYLVNWTSITNVKRTNETADFVKGYSNIEAKLNGTHHLADIKSIPTFFRWNRTIGTGFKGSNVINVKTSSVENAIEGEGVNEFVLYLHTWDNHKPIGWSEKPASTVDKLFGTSWSVYEGTRPSTNETVRSLVPKDQVESELYIDLKVWLNAMVAKGFAKSQDYLNAASCGTEVLYGNSTQNAAVALNINV